jgi:arylsulfatase A-like enzyme
MKETFLAAALSLLLPAGFSSAASQPNILLILVDDMGVMDTSVPFLTDADGNPVRHPLNEFYRTPAMETLAARGIRFNQFYAMSVCSPTRVSIMTGQNAARHTVTNWINPDQNNAGPQGPPDWNWQGLKKGDVTLPGLLRQAGYHTIHVGKGHFGAREFEGANPANLGFDINIAGGSIGAPGSYYGARNFSRQSGGKGKGRGAGNSVIGLEKYHGQDIFLTEALTLEARDAARQAVAAGKPFYLYFAQYAVHGPFESDPRFADHYKNSGKPEQAQAFATLIEGMDKSLNDMLHELEALGVAEDTLILFVGDNGSDAPLGLQHEVACAAPLRGKKGAHYEGGMRVPFIAAWAKPDPANPNQQKLPIPAGAIQSQVANVTDILPTLLALVGVEAPASHPVDGRPLQTLLTGRRDDSRPEQFLMHYPHGPHRSNYFTVWRDGDWKVIHHFLPNIPTHGDLIQSQGRHFELFNLKDDPYEQNDLATSQPDQLRTMMQALAAQLEAHGALYPMDQTGAPLKPSIPPTNR